MGDYFTISDVEKQTGILRYRLDYAINVLKICEPTRFANQRVFTSSDLQKLIAHFK